MKNYYWSLITLFFGALILLVTSCSNTSDKVEISKKDWDIIRSMEINNNDVLISPVNNEPEIFDLDGNPLFANKIYLRKEGILQIVDLHEEIENSIMIRIQDSTARWILNPDLWVRSINAVSSWRSIQADLLYLEKINLSVERKTYVTFSLPVSVKVIFNDGTQDTVGYVKGESVRIK